MAKTMVGMASPFAGATAATSTPATQGPKAAPGPSATPTPTQTPAQPPAGAQKKFGSTMLGMPSPSAAPKPPADAPATPPRGTEPKAPAQTSPRQPLSPAHAGAASAAPGSTPAGAPGSAPVAQHSMAHTQVGATPAGLSATGGSSASAAPQEKRKFQGTLLGVAQPGIAPSHDAPAPPQAYPGPSMQTPTPSLQQARSPEVVATQLSSGQAPLPSVPQQASAVVSPADDPLRPAAHSVPVQSRLPIAKRPVWQPVALVAAGLLGAAALGGLVAKLRERPIQVVVTEFSVNSDGNDELSLMCPDCPDESILQLGDASTAFAKGRATILPTKPLELGNNEFELLLNNKQGEPLTVKPLVVPVAFRMSTNWSGMAADPPYGEVVVQAPAGSEVKVDGKEVRLENGKAIYKVSLAEQSLGESRKTTKFSQSLDVSVTTAGKERKAQATLQGLILPLQLSSIGPVHQLLGKDVTIAGTTTPGATISVAGVEPAASTTAGEDGQFVIVLKQPRPGKYAVESTLKNHLMRRVTLNLSDKVLVAKEAQTKFSKIAGGGDVNLLGNVLESRVADGITQTLFDIESGCDAPPCLLRGIYAEPHRLVPNRKVRIAGLASPGDPVTVRVRKYH